MWAQAQTVDMEFWKILGVVGTGSLMGAMAVLVQAKVVKRLNSLH